MSGELETGTEGDIGRRDGRLGLTVNRVRPAYQQVADQLRELILGGSLSSGDRLPSEADLAGTFGVSRSTVREALRLLASRDLIHTTRGTTGGTFVSTIQFDQVSDYLETSIGLMSGSDTVSVAEMLEARELLEVPSARLAAVRHEAHHLDAMRQAIDREMTSRGRSGRFREHRTFHAVIVDASGNRLVSMMTGPVFGVLQAKFLSPDVPPSFWKRVDSDHENILSAIRDCDGEAAAAEMASHLMALREVYSE